MTTSLSDVRGTKIRRPKSSEPGIGQLLVVDFFSLAIPLVGSFQLLHQWNDGFTLTSSTAWRSAIVCCGAILWMVYALGMYRPVRGLPRRVKFQTIRAAFIVTPTILLAITVAPIWWNLRLYIGFAALGWAVLFAASRVVLTQVHAGCRQRLLVVTAASGPDQDEVIRRLELAPDSVELVGIIDYQDYSTVLDSVADVDLVAMVPNVPDNVRVGLAAATLVGGARLLLIPDPMESAALGGSSANWFGVDGRELDLYRHAALQGRIKRLIDLVGATVGLAAVLPVLLVVAAVIRRNSPGPVLFRQTRVGLHGREFAIAKFRTMTVDAEASTGAVFASANDARITSVGKWLRLTRLDELPQLWNVIVGDMSLIGPRPERPEFVVGFAAQIPGYELRHGVRPGISGLAQVRARYSATPEEKLRFDLEYVFGHTLWADARIIVQTVATMLDLSAAEGSETPTAMREISLVSTDDSSAPTDAEPFGERHP